MSEFFVHLAHAAAWVGGIVLLFAIIGFIATIRWIAGIFTGAERAVGSGVSKVEDTLQRK
jgi:hypothetical protein